METREGFFTGCDGTRLYFHAEGHGPPMIACNGIGVSTFFWRRYVAHFKDRYQFICWDYPGHGASESAQDGSRLTIPDLAHHMHALASHLELQKPLLFGHSMGVQVILEYYRHYPQEVGALIPVLGSYGSPVDTFLNFRYSRPAFQQLINFSRRFPTIVETFQRLVFDPRYAVLGANVLRLVDRLYCPPEAMFEYFQHIGSLDTRMLLDMGQGMADHSARDILEQIHVPTLIVAGEFDLLTPIQLSYEMRDKIPGAELAFIRHGTHTSLIEQPGLVIDRIEAFLRRHDFEQARGESQMPLSAVG